MRNVPGACPGFREAALVVGRLAAVILVVAGWSAGPVRAQEDLTRGKTAAQLFASDCADCHRNPRALGNRTDANRLAAFLRVHYTASRESAATIASYLVSLGPDTTRGARPSTPSRSKPSTSQSQGKPNQDAQPADAKPAADKPAEPKPAEATVPKPPEAVPQTPADSPASAGDAAPAASPADPQ